MKFQKLLIFFAFMAAGMTLQADDRKIILDHPLHLNFTPLDAYFFLDYGRGFSRRIHGVLRAAGRGGEEGLEPGLWLVGAVASLPEKGRKLSYSVLVLGKNADEFSFIPPLKWSSANAQPYGGSLEKVLTSTAKKRKELKKLNIENAARERELKRLRADAAIIADVDKILLIKEELERTKTESTALDDDIATLNNALKRVRGIGVPRNFSIRESQLIRQIAELAGISKAAESTESERGRSAETDLLKKKALINETRFDDLNTLRRTLNRLEKIIARLEEEKNHLMPKDLSTPEE